MSYAIDTLKRMLLQAKSLSIIDALGAAIMGLTELEQMKADRDEACGELRISVKDAAPGTVIGKLVSANVILKHMNADLLSRAVDAEQERDALMARMAVEGEE